MKRSIALFLLPLALFALERVNLIKDAGFEKDSDVWQTYIGRSDGWTPDSIIANNHDSERSFHGNYSGSSDNRKGVLAGAYYDSTMIIQGFCCPKEVSDFDSLNLYYALAAFNPSRLQAAWIAIYTNAGKSPCWIAGYMLFGGSNPTTIPPNKMIQYFNFPPDTLWYTLNRDVYHDLIASGIDPSANVDSFLLMGIGAYMPSVRLGQKLYWDNIRLTGYADYDVGVKEILSGDSVWEGIYYKPVARIKNFGREAADDFLAIAEIRQGESVVWADTVPYTLPTDTEDTLEFGSFPVPDAASYTLTIRTVMYAPGALDESDEDDALSKPLYGTAIAEQAGVQAISLEVESFTANPRISYSLPDGQSGVLRVYDASGRRIESLKVQGSGEMGLLSALSPGVYFARLEAGRTISRKLIVLR